MSNLNRRQFIHGTGISLGATLTGLGAAETTTPAQRKMTICLSGGAIGVSANQKEAIRLAHQYGFESVEAFPEYLAGLAEGEMADLLSDLKTRGLVFGSAGLPLEFRQDEAKYSASLARLPKLAAGLARAGVTRLGTWLMPGDSARPYLENLRLHARRLREAATVLKDHGQRMGLEYVGTKTSRDRLRYPFIHSLAETKELMAEIGTGNVGVVLDSWHWWQADDTVADLLTLPNDAVVSVDLNDAPSGLAKDKQLDGKRELPAATGVIEVGAFLGALNQIGYDGPVRAEPFNKALNDLNNDEACAATITALKRAFALLK